MSDLGNEVARILKSEAYRTVVSRFEASLTQIVMNHTTTDEDRKEALSVHKALIGIEQSLLAEAFNADKENQ